MKKKIFWIAGLIIFISALFFINNYLNNRDVAWTTEKVEYSSEMIQDSENNQNSLSHDKSIPIGKIIQGNSSNFEELVLNNRNTVLVDFYADWCPPCRKLSPIIEEVASENTNENLLFVRINIDDEEALAAQYGIQSIPTLVLIQNGEEVDRSIGFIDKKSIKEFLNQ